LFKEKSKKFDNNIFKRILLNFYINDKDYKALLKSIDILHHIKINNKIKILVKTFFDLDR
jgi:hypothetical protein